MIVFILQLNEGLELSKSVDFNESISNCLNVKFYENWQVLKTTDKKIDSQWWLSK